MEIVLCNPFENAQQLQVLNPLGKIPTLVHNDLVLYDSPVICQYLDELAEPWLDSDRMIQLRQSALADGVIDSALAIVLENRRTDNLRSLDWIDRQMTTIKRSLPVMQGELNTFKNSHMFSQVTFGCALGYLDFRLTDFDWRSGYRGLANWFGDFNARDSMLQSRPPA